VNKGGARDDLTSRPLSEVDRLASENDRAKIDPASVFTSTKWPARKGDFSPRRLWLRESRCLGGPAKRMKAERCEMCLTRTFG
jgi:hypothetical protein